MKIITPVTITDGMLVSSSLPETDHAAWNPSTSYAVADRVVLASTHSIYQRTVAGVSATPPSLDSANWARVGPTNRWAMFDRATGTLSSGTGSITATIAPGMVRGVALLDVTGNSVTVTVTNGASTVYTKTVNLNTGYGVTSWYDYFFGDIVRKSTVVLSDIPPYSACQITVTVDGSGPVSVGTFVAGSLFELGKSRHGTSLGIIDYSVKSTDAYGATTVTQRAFAKRMTVPVVVNAYDVDEVARRLALIRATPVVWIGSETYDQSVIYGFYKDWSVDVAYPTFSHCSLTIEGLS
jgi:hypothetical protein